MTKINLSTLAFEDAPTGFDQTGTLFNTRIAELNNGHQVIVAYDLYSKHSSLSLEGPIKGNWADSCDTQDWPALDKAFGRKEWQAFIAEHQAEAEAELDEWDALEGDE